MSEDDKVIDINKYREKRERAEAKRIFNSILDRPTCTVNLKEEEQEDD